MFNMDGGSASTGDLFASGGLVGIGFRYSSNLAKPIAQIREFGHVRRGWIGVRIQTVSPELAGRFASADAKGALIASVSAKGPPIAGIRQGDVVLKFDGKEITDMRGLPRIVAETLVNRRCPWWSGAPGQGSRPTATVAGVPGDRANGERRTGRHRNPISPRKAPGRSRVELTLARRQARKDFDLRRRRRGRGGDKDRPRQPVAAEKDLQQGDVIVEVDQAVNRPTTSATG